MGVSSSAIDRHMCDESSVPWLRPVDGLPHHQRAIHKATVLSSSSTTDRLSRSTSFTQTWNAIPTEEEDEHEEGEEEPADNDRVGPARAPARALHSHGVGSSVIQKKRFASIQAASKTMTSQTSASLSSLETSIQETLVGHEVTSKHGTGTIIQYLHQEGNKHHFLLQVRRKPS